ncbi:MAG: hypothetical protein DRP42_04655 [Tenericutes bacterium]|nr:MAG: hypothetical protein DRP42_04655 [Mycoplasmatota bacterium]
MTLNKQQQQAVDKIIGPVRIIAGPGTGKTRTITSKIGKILTEGHANSDEILFLTFTNKAAKEAKSRIEIEVGVDNLPKVFTYHSFCA